MGSLQRKAFLCIVLEKEVRNMQEFILFILCLLVVYLLYYLVVISKKNKREKLVMSTECIYLEKKYHIDVKKIPIKKLANHLALTNAFIMSFTVLVISMVKSWILKFTLGMIVLMLLIVVCYHILGKIYQKKYKEDVK